MIRTITVIGHGTDLLPHFIDHYESQVDRMEFIIYETDMYPKVRESVLSAIEGKSNTGVVKIVKDRVFDWERVTRLYNEVKSVCPDDWWVIADIDEFHLYPSDDLRSMIAECERNGWDIVRGGFIDRIGPDGGFPKLSREKNIFSQYPMMGFFRYPMSGACPNKICVTRGSVEVSNGQHYAVIDGHTTWRWQGWSHPMIAPIEKFSVQVHHFKWDESCIDRIRAVAGVKKDYAYSDEYWRMYEALKRTEFKIDILDPAYMFEMNRGYASYYKYKGWNRLMNKIAAV